MLVAIGVTVVVVGLWLGRLRIVRVAGDSMLPMFGDGALLVTVPARPGRIRIHMVVTCHDPREPKRVMVKRVAARLDDLLDVRGDNPDASTDSRTFGLLRIEAVTGRVLFRLTRGRKPV